MIDAREPGKAVGLLEEAHGVLLDVESGFELMRAYDALDKLVEAATLGDKLVALPVVPKEGPSATDARKKVKDALAALSTRTPTLQLQIKRPSKDLVRVKIDDRMLTPEQLDKPIRVNSGNRVVFVTAPGYRPLEVPQVVEKGSSRQYPVIIDMAPIPTPNDQIVRPEEPNETSTHTRLVNAGIGASSAFGLVALATGIAAGASYGGVADAYNRQGCNADCDIEVARRGPALQVLTVTATVTGVAALATGAMTWIYARSERKEPERVSYGIMPTPGGIVVHGRW